jgi:hypothetical protein
MEKIYDKIYEPLSDEDLRKMLPDVPIVRYEDLEDVEDIREILNAERSAFVLFVATVAENGGHWTALLRNRNKIYYFCSYGTRPDKNLLWAPKNLRKGFGQNIPYLSYLLNKAKDDGFKVSFNEVQYQSKNPDIQTCGRWVASRILFHKYEVNNSPENYKKMITKFMKENELTSDLTIVALTT